MAVVDAIVYVSTADFLASSDLLLILNEQAYRLIDFWKMHVRTNMFKMQLQNIDDENNVITVTVHEDAHLPIIPSQFIWVW